MPTALLVRADEVIEEVYLLPTRIVKLKFTQIGIPPNRYSGHYRGWIETYWTPMKEIFAAGTISQRTKDRVKIDREQRIKPGRFRRSISNQA
jgi:hypothetical protein